MELLAVALLHRSPLRFLELYELKIDNPNYARIFSVVPKMRWFTLVTNHSLSRRHMFLFAKALVLSVVELQSIYVKQSSRPSLNDSPLNEKQVAAALERRRGIITINGGDRARFFDLWPSVSKQ